MARDLPDFTTPQEAKTANFDHRTGSLTPGNDVDIFILNTDAPNSFPINIPIGAEVAIAQVGSIDSVFVRGRAVNWLGMLVVEDIKALRRRTAAKRRRPLWPRRSGTQRELVARALYRRYDCQRVNGLQPKVP